MPQPVLKGPVSAVLYIHNAILKETQEFEEAAKELNRENSSQVTALLDRFKFFRQVLKVHEDGEELAIFPPLEAKFKHLATTYVFDHHHHLGSYPQIEDTLTAIVRARHNNERIELARRLNRQGIALNVVMEQHISKENELLYPLYDQLFSFDEQRAHEAAIMEHMPPPDLMARMGVWMFKAQAPKDREGLLRVFAEMLPPEHLPGMMKLMAGAVTPKEWQEAVRGIPELASLPR